MVGDIRKNWDTFSSLLIQYSIVSRKVCTKLSLKLWKRRVLQRVFGFSQITGQILKVHYLGHKTSALYKSCEDKQEASTTLHHQLMSVKKYVLSQLSVKLQLVPTTYFRALLMSYLNKHSITCSLLDRHIYCTACLPYFAKIRLFKLANKSFLKTPISILQWSKISITVL